MMRAAPAFLCAAALAALIGPPASAQSRGCFGAGEPLFYCQVNGGRIHLDVCLVDNVVVYRYGPPNDAAELFLPRDVTQVEHIPWNGVGSTIYEELSLWNGAYSYTVFALAERAPGKRPEGGVRVSENGRVLAELSCDPGTASPPDFTPLFNAKRAAGQCWDRAEFVWNDC